MNKTLYNKIEKYVKITEYPFAKYFTECPINYNDNYYGYKYFFCYHGTHKIANAFKNQQELNEYLNEKIKH